MAEPADDNEAVDRLNDRCDCRIGRRLHHLRKHCSICQKRRPTADQTEYDSFQAPTEFADFELKVDETSFFVNPWYLAEKSPVFTALCLSDSFKEKEEKVATIQEESSEDILEFLRCICPCSPYLTPKPVTAANFGLLIRLADKFDVAHLKAACERYLNEEFDYIEAEPAHVIKMLMAADRIRLGKDAVGKLIARAATFDIDTLKAHELHKNLSNYVVAVLFTANGKYRAENKATSAAYDNNAASSNHRGLPRKKRETAYAWSTCSADPTFSADSAHLDSIGSPNHLFHKTDTGDPAKFYINCSICQNSNGRGTYNLLCLKCCKVLCPHCEVANKCPKLVMTPIQLANLRNKMPTAEIDDSMLE